MASEYEFCLVLFRSPDLQRRDAIWPVVAGHLSGRFNAPDAFNPCPLTVPDQFVPGPTFAALGCEVDCDGRSYHAYKISAANLADAKKLAEKYDDVYDVVPASPSLFPPDNDDWSEWGYFMESGYANLGMHLSEVGRDDTAGTILDHTYDY